MEPSLALSSLLPDTTLRLWPYPPSPLGTPTSSPDTCRVKMRRVDPAVSLSLALPGDPSLTLVKHQQRERPDQPSPCPASDPTPSSWLGSSFPPSQKLPSLEATASPGVETPAQTALTAPGVPVSTQGSSREGSLDFCKPGSDQECLLKRIFPGGEPTEATAQQTETPVPVPLPDTNRGRSSTAPKLPSMGGTRIWDNRFAPAAHPSVLPPSLKQGVPGRGRIQPGISTFLASQGGRPAQASDIRASLGPSTLTPLPTPVEVPSKGGQLTRDATESVRLLPSPPKGVLCHVVRTPPTKASNAVKRSAAERSTDDTHLTAHTSRPWGGRDVPTLSAADEEMRDVLRKRRKKMAVHARDATSASEKRGEMSRVMSRYVCQHCRRSFPKSQSLSSHLQSHSSGEIVRGEPVACAPPQSLLAQPLPLGM